MSELETRIVRLEEKVDRINDYVAEDKISHQRTLDKLDVLIEKLDVQIHDIDKTVAKQALWIKGIAFVLFSSGLVGTGIWRFLA